MEVAKPIIKLVSDNRNDVRNLKTNLFNNNKSKEKKLICDYPTVYIHNWKKDDKFEVYVGESNDFFQRTDHHHTMMDKSDKWQCNLKTSDAYLYLIAHEDFNKSLTLDIENRLIHYLSSSNSVSKVHNARGNPQKKYFTSEELDDVFSKIWKQLRTYNRDLFLNEDEIKDSAIFKASPLHKLNTEQLAAKENILDGIDICLLNNQKHQLIFVQGNAGTGKTVLMSSLFNDLINKKEHIIDFNKSISRDLECAILVNHDEQLTVYKEIVKKLDLGNDAKLVFKPTQFINLFKDKKNFPKKRDKLYDVVLVDEAHLLLTQKNQAYTEENIQLDEILNYAKVVVVMFDRKQIMNTEQYLDANKINEYIKLSKENNNYIELSSQMRINASKEILNWLDSFCIDGIIEKLSKNRGKYDIKSFDSPKELEKEIRRKAGKEKTSLSRIIATYDWPFSSNSISKDDLYWNVKIGDWYRPWNRELIRHDKKIDSKIIKGLSWAEQPHTLNEIGSIYTIQGFDLNYAGVILGPSVKYRNGKIIFDPTCSCNDKAVQKRTLSDGTKKSFGTEFLKNELGVLLTRGVNGLYIYAYDEELRKKLKQCI